MKTPAAGSWLSILILTVATATPGQGQIAPGPDQPITASPALPRLSRAAADVVQLTQSGLDESVLLSFIANCSAFNLAADHIIYLNDLGVPPLVINTMLKHDRDTATRQRELELARLALLATNQSPALDVLSAATVAADQQTAPAIRTNGVAAVALQGSLTTTVAAASAPPTTNAPAFATQIHPKRAKPLYPVREPYPVEITAPIVFLEPPNF